MARDWRGQNRRRRVRIGFIGGGVMAEAMIKGILGRELAAPQDLTVGEVLADRRRSLEESYHVHATEENRAALGRSDIAVVAVKPQQIAAALGPLKGSVPPACLVLSIAAGVRIATIQGLLAHRPVVRVMPNTPAQVGYGMSVWTATPEATSPQRAEAASILRALGKEIYVEDEHYLDMATALSGSGPGYVLLFLEALIDAGVHVGLPRPMAEVMARQTLLGTAHLAEETGRHPAELRNMVTSPGGTTAEGLLALEEDGLRAAVIHAVLAAYEKSQALG
ncbi:MAG: pyrroline-5-carboxylate reductase [Chloroflexi bacterium]|nr:pyrroline-5-carboxylate reductase [Chloroflexota bacterium]